MGKHNTLKQRQFVKHYIESKGDAVYAYKKTFPKATPKTIGRSANTFLDKCKPSVTELLDKMGLDDFMLIAKLTAGMDAKKSAKVTPEDYDMLPDWTNRQKFLDMAFKLKGAYPKVAVEDKSKDLKPRKVSFTKSYEFPNKSDNQIQSKANEGS